MSKPLFVLPATALLVAMLVACGCASTRSTSQTSSVEAESASIPKPSASLKAPQRPGIRDTYDEDDTARRGVEENDDEEIEIYGHAANATEWRSATAFVKSYYAAAVAEDGAAACQLLVPSLAQGLGGSYEKSSEPTYLHGKTCAEVMTKLFKYRHKLMAAENAGFEVTDVRATSKTDFILLAFKGIRERRFMGVQREGNSWGLEALTDSQYP
jgi:hypothetical protein